MSITENDLRVKITVSILENSLLEIAKSKPIKEISISEICEHANVSRSTFYRHFDSIDVFYKHIQTKLFNESFLCVMDLIHNYNCDAVLKYTKIVYRNKDFNSITYSSLEGKKALRYFENQIVAEILKKFPDTDNSFGQSTLYYSAKYLSFSLTSIFEDWILNGYKESPEEMARIFCFIYDNSLYPLIKKYEEYYPK